MSIRLDEMTIDEVEKYYHNIFLNNISEQEFANIAESYRVKYKELVHYRDLGYKTAGGMGRGFKYDLAMLYGWYIEELIYTILTKNIYIKEIEYSGNDSEHSFEFDDKGKLIKIKGNKTTNPDFFITLKDNRTFFIELKTAAAGIFTIKKGNVEQLYKTMGATGIYSIILMVDIINGLYSFDDINNFTDLHPFVNQRMEGQLCYEMAIPSIKFSNLMSEDFLKNCDNSIFENPRVKKYKMLSIAETQNNNLKKVIKNKISFEKKVEEYKYQLHAAEEELKLYTKKHPEVLEYEWNQIYELLKNK